MESTTPTEKVPAFVVCLERGVYLAPDGYGGGDPDRTLLLGSAERFDTDEAAHAALYRAQSYRPFEDGEVFLVNPPVREGWTMPEAPQPGAIAVAHCVGPEDGWDLYWATPEQVRDEPGERVADIPWPFDQDVYAGQADFDRLGFVSMERAEELEVLAWLGLDTADARAVADVTVGDPSSILLIPAEGDPHGLLKEGVCCARPPMALRTRDHIHASRMALPCNDDCYDCDHEYVEQCMECGHAWPCPEAGNVSVPGRWESVRYLKGLVGGYPGEALVLAWKGVLVPEGMDRATGVLGHILLNLHADKPRPRTVFFWDRTMHTWSLSVWDEDHVEHTFGTEGAPTDSPAAVLGRMLNGACVKGSLIYVNADDLVTSVE
jgi:hypothetical protein